MGSGCLHYIYIACVFSRSALYALHIPLTIESAEYLSSCTGDAVAVREPTLSSCAPGLEMQAGMKLLRSPSEWYGTYLQAWRG